MTLRELFGSTDAHGRPALVSRAARAGGFVYTSGVTARDDKGGVPSGIPAQMEAILSRLEAILAEAGASFKDVLKVNIYVTTMEHKAEINDIYRRYFPIEAPARAMVQVSGLASPEYLIEVEMVAVDPAFSGKP